MYQNILIAYDGSAGSQNALKIAAELAIKLNSKLWALWVAGSLPQYHETKAEFDEEKNQIEIYFNKLENEISVFTHQLKIEIEFSYLQGNPSKLIVDFAKENNIDLVILGSSGHSGLWGRFLGHVPDKVSDNAHCDVMIVRK